MLIVSGTFEIHPDDCEAALRAARTMAEASRAEPRCRSYEFFRDLDRPDRFRVFEEWEDLGALEEHFSTPHMAEFRKVLGTLRILDREIYKYETTGREPL